MGLLIIPILLVTFIVRVLPRFRIKYAYSGDTYGHFHISRAIRENKFRIPDKIPGVTLNHTHTYPYLYHLILSVFTQGQRAVFERMSSALFDTVSVLVVYLFSGWISDSYLGNKFPGFALLAAGVYAIAPPLLMISRGPRAYRGTPRVFGQTLYIIHITSFFYYYSTGEWAGLIVSILSASLLFISAKFGVQVLVFFGIIFSIFLTWHYAVVIMLSYILITILSGGRVLRVTSGQVRYNEFYLRFAKAKGSMKGLATDWLELKVFLSRLRRNTISLFKGKVLDFASWLFGERYFLYFLIIAFPQVILLFFIFDKIDLQSPLSIFLWTWFWGSVICFFITSISYVRFLGQGERYLEYGLPSSIILSLYFLLNSGLDYIIIGFLIYSILVYIIHVRIFIVLTKEKNDSYFEDNRIFEFLKSQEKGIVLPIHNEWEVLYKTQFPLLFYGSNVDMRKIPLEKFTSIYYNMHTPSPDLEKLVREYDVKYIFSTHNHLKEYLESVILNKEMFYDLTDQIFESKNFILYKVKS